MQFATSSALIAAAAAYFAISAQALPRPQAQPTYSVVDVDGGLSSTIVSPTTVYQTITESSGAQPTAETTVSVTIIESASEPASTSSSSAFSGFLPGYASTVSFGSDTTVTSTIPAATASVVESAPTVVIPAGPQGYPVTIQPSAYANATPSTSTTSSTTISSISSITTSPAASTVTIVSISIESPTQTSTSYYDNGMWHNRYPVKRPQFTQPAAWNNTAEDVYQRAPAASGTGAADLYARVAASGTGAHWVKRVVAATGTGYLAGRAAPTGYSVVSWNETKQW